MGKYTYNERISGMTICAVIASSKKAFLRNDEPENGKYDKVSM